MRRYKGTLPFLPPGFIRDRTRPLSACVPVEEPVESGKDFLLATLLSSPSYLLPSVAVRD